MHDDDDISPPFAWVKLMAKEIEIIDLTLLENEISYACTLT